MNFDKNYHYHSLDLLRGISGYGVAICHFYAFFYQNPTYEYFSLLFVEFFFVLSGFVLYPQLIEVLNNKKNLIIFYKRRWLRTIPLYIFCLILASFIFDELFSKDFFKYLFFVQDLFPDFVSNNYYPVAWSLAVEEFFYLVFPVIVIFFGKKNFLKKIIILLVLIYVLKILFINEFSSNFYRTGTIFRFDAILIGFLARYFLIYVNNKYMPIILLICSLILFGYFESNIVNEYEDDKTKFLFVLGVQIISLISLVTFINFEKFITNDQIKKIFSLISKQTYSVYLFHLILIHLMLKIDYTGSFPVLVYFLLLFAISSVLYYFFELPFLKIRPKILRSDK